MIELGFVKNDQEYVIKFYQLKQLKMKKFLDLYFVKEAWNAKRLKAGFFQNHLFQNKEVQDII